MKSLKLSKHAELARKIEQSTQVKGISSKIASLSRAADSGNIGESDFNSDEAGNK
jgi:hypothetical protein